MFHALFEVDKCSSGIKNIKKALITSRDLDEDVLLFFISPFSAKIAYISVNNQKLRFDSLVSMLHKI